MANGAGLVALGAGYPWITHSGFNFTSHMHESMLLRNATSEWVSW